MPLAVFLKKIVVEFGNNIIFVTMAWQQLFLKAIRNYVDDTKYCLEIIVPMLSISVAKKCHPVGHRLYRTYYHYVALAQDKDLKY